MIDRNERPGHYTLRQTMGVVTVFAIAFGLWHTNSFDVILATIVALGGSSIVLLRSQRRRIGLLIRSVVSVSKGLLAAFLYAAKSGDDAKHYQIGTAIAAALGCWIVMTFVSDFVIPRMRRSRIGCG